MHTTLSTVMASYAPVESHISISAATGFGQDVYTNAKYVQSGSIDDGPASSQVSHGMIDHFTGL